MCPSRVRRRPVAKCGYRNAGRGALTREQGLSVPQSLTPPTHHSRTPAEAPKFGTPHAARSSTTRPGRAEGMRPNCEDGNENARSKYVWYFNVTSRSGFRVVDFECSVCSRCVQEAQEQAAGNPGPSYDTVPAEGGRNGTQKERLRGPKHPFFCPAFPFIFGTVQQTRNPTALVPTSWSVLPQPGAPAPLR
jgi:hypothetical protein